MKACPACAEMIQDAATKCRFCGSDVRGKEIQWSGANVRITGVLLHLFPVWAIAAPFFIFRRMDGRSAVLYVHIALVAALCSVITSILVALDARWARLVSGVRTTPTGPSALARKDRGLLAKNVPVLAA
jgi:hypothetical protein